MNRPDRAGFWRWSHSRYARDGVAPLLLQLQDQFGLDVNILLWCGWCAERYRAIPLAIMEPAAESVDAWSQDVVKPLRGARRALKKPPVAHALSAARLRDDVKLAELAAEKIAHEMLELAAETNLTPAESDSKAKGRFRANLAIYTLLAGREPQPVGLSALLDQLVVRLFGDVTPADSDEGENA